MKFIIVVGTVVRGVTFYGPFDEEAQAKKWAEKYFTNIPWCVSFMMPVDLKHYSAE